MKIFKAGFAAIMGILAIGFTIAAETGAFKGMKLVPPTEGCFRRVTILCPGDPIPKLLPSDGLCPPFNPCSFGSNTVIDVTLKVLIPTPIGNCPTAPILCCYFVEPKLAPATGFMVTGFQCGNFTPARK